MFQEPVTTGNVPLALSHRKQIMSPLEPLNRAVGVGPQLGIPR
jgi:hypothetical protein